MSSVFLGVKGVTGRLRTIAFIFLLLSSVVYAEAESENVDVGEQSTEAIAPSQQTTKPITAMSAPLSITSLMSSLTMGATW
ncbi:hypothetical protein [Leptolyngbya sp. 7M]|uniref:hypothetical protein n=1 Tax=Leptolyngbya sp. 7M TaxID=2812896 RepID=UPI001B8BC7F5|nr:hypothetical protein [Leptolyngbya sp. 7M]QYO64797.1 hypothetical protein JVX88_35360 [Leptolyngbya sp. 7M]